MAPTELATATGEAEVPARGLGASVAHPYRLPVFAAALSVATSGLWIGIVEALLPAGRTLSGALFRWDAYWYQMIAVHGYEWAPRTGRGQNVVFFPLYPLFERAAHDLTGVPIPNIAVISSIAFQSVAAGLLVLVARCTGASERQATVFVTLFLIGPASVFDIMGYYSALFCMLCFLTLLLAYRGRPFLAAASCGLACATNPLGLALAAGLVLWRLMGLLSARTATRRSIGALVAQGFVSVSGLLAYMAYLFVRFDDPFAFYQAISGWAPSLPLRSTLERLVTLQPLRSTMLELPLRPNAAAVSSLVDSVATLLVLGLLAFLVATGSWRTPAFLALAVAFVFVQLQAARWGRELSTTRLLLPTASLAGAVPALGRVLTRPWVYASTALLLLVGTAVFLQHLAVNAWVD